MARMEWEWKHIFAGMDGIAWTFCGDGSETGWRWVGMHKQFVGTGGDGCKFCPHAGLYAILY